MMGGGTLCSTVIRPSSRLLLVMSASGAKLAHRPLNVAQRFALFLSSLFLPRRACSSSSPPFLPSGQFCNLGKPAKKLQQDVQALLQGQRLKLWERQQRMLRSDCKAGVTVADAAAEAAL